MISAVDVHLPGFRQSVALQLAGTPVTYAYYTGRHRGLVGGFPQTNLFRAWPPRLGPGVWMVGDSIFPGQSTAAVALGGLRVANTIIDELGLSTEPVPPRLGEGTTLSQGSA